MRSKRLEDIEKKIADLKALAADEKRRVSVKERKRETRRKILFTGEIYARLKRQERITLVCESTKGKEEVTFRTIHDVEKWVLQHLSRPADFSAFNVDDILGETQESTPTIVEAKAPISKPKKDKAPAQLPAVPAAIAPHPATLPIATGTTVFPQFSTKEDQPPNTAKAAKPANSNAPKTAKPRTRKLPEVGQDEMKKQFLM